ncbi:MAG: RecB-family nuclease, partial [Sulfolobales archaeon]
MIKGLFIVANNASSPQRLIDVAKVVYNFEYSNIINTLVITKPVGSAAQVGIPEISKLAYKLGRTLVILPSINEA